MENILNELLFVLAACIDWWALWCLGRFGGNGEICAGEGGSEDSHCELILRRTLAGHGPI